MAHGGWKVGINSKVQTEILCNDASFTLYGNLDYGFFLNYEDKWLPRGMIRMNRTGAKILDLNDLLFTIQIEMAAVLNCNCSIDDIADIQIPSDEALFERGGQVSEEGFIRWFQSEIASFDRRNFVWGVYVNFNDWIFYVLDDFLVMHIVLSVSIPIGENIPADRCNQAIEKITNCLCLLIELENGESPLESLLFEYRHAFEECTEWMALCIDALRDP